MVQMLFPYIAAVFQDDNLPVHTARSVQSWFEQREAAFQHLPWPAQSSDLNTIELLWSVLESTVTSSVPPPPYLKQPEDVLHGQWHNSAMEIVQNLNQSIPRRIQVVLEANGGTIL
jgi:transposase